MSFTAKSLWVGWPGRAKRIEQGVRRLAPNWKQARHFAATLACLVALNLHADIPTSGFDAANKLYEQARFADAAAAYEKLLHSGQVSTAVYFNLGNAFFKSGQIGRAVVAYRNARQLAPRDPDLQANLRFARNQVVNPTFQASRLENWLTKLTLTEWTLLAGGTVWVWLLLLTFFQWRPALRQAWRGYLITLGVLAGFLGAGFGFNWWQSQHAQTSVVISREAVVHQGPLDESPSSFTVHDGAELRVLDQKDEWLQVTTDPRRIGWIKRDQVVITSGT